MLKARLHEKNRREAAGTRTIVKANQAKTIAEPINAICLRQEREGEREREKDVEIGREEESRQICPANDLSAAAGADYQLSRKSKRRSEKNNKQKTTRSSRKERQGAG